LLKVELFCVCDVDDICGGIVFKVDGESRGAVHFCTRLRGDCQYVTTHQENKAFIEDQTYYINTPRAYMARWHPSLSMMCLQVPLEDNDTQLENCLQTMDVWVTYLNAINTHEAMNLAGRESAKKPMAVTGMEEDGGSGILPTDSTWVCVFAPSLSTFVRDMAGLKTLGRPNRRRVARVDSDHMTVEDPLDSANVKAIEPEPTTDLAALRPNL
jgi:hypothetical protein